MKRNDILKYLSEHGCKFVREGGNHIIYINPTNGKQTSLGRHQELTNLLYKKIFKQLDIPSI